MCLDLNVNLYLGLRCRLGFGFGFGLNFTKSERQSVNKYNTLPRNALQRKIIAGFGTKCFVFGLEFGLEKLTFFFAVEHS
jgi:hypothetical protein